ncbi:disulfide bond formation protein B [Candidatus Nomurabacteria bacterium]|nr:disulfide bond formation protein B [Candidatus Nomurabacteria bacterium]
MLTYLPFINTLIGIGVTLAGINGIIAFYFFITKKENAYTRWVQKYALWIGLKISVLAVLVSLFYSDVVGYLPCKLCWFARIFMYPQVILFAIALRKKIPVRLYSIALTIGGLLITLYHNYIYLGGYSPLPCDAAASCTQRFVFELGFITIPFMATAGFVAILGVLLLYKEHNA